MILTKLEQNTLLKSTMIVPETIQPTLVVRVELSTGSVCLSVPVSRQWLLNQMTFHLDIWYAGSP